MKHLLNIGLLLTFTLSQGQENYIRSTKNTAETSSTLTHKGRLILGDERSSASYFPLQVYSQSPNESTAIILGNSAGRWEFAVAGGNGSFHNLATPGTGIIRKLGNHNMIFFMPNDNMVDPDYDTTNWNSSGITSIRFSDSVNQNSLLIYNTGKVTMGTPKYDNDSNYRLYVKDGIKTERVKVEIANTNGWADFVFKKSYKLPTLYEVERQIEEKGHLNDIPSEEEVLKNGIELGEMSSKLLQKIEELMLYTIQQQKIIDKLQREVDSLKN